MERFWATSTIRSKPMFYKVEVEKSMYIELIVEADTEEQALEAAENAMYFDEYDEKIEDCGWEYDIENITDKVHPSIVDSLRLTDTYVDGRSNHDTKKNL